MTSPPSDAFSRIKIGLFLYLAIGLVYAVVGLSSSRGDMPNWTTLLTLVRALPGSLSNLVLAVLFSVLLPIAFWPLFLVFQLFAILG
jgi:hypothetical protein